MHSFHKTSRLLATILTASLSLSLVACGEKKPEVEKTAKASAVVEKQPQETLGTSEESQEPTNLIRMDLEGGGSIVLELYPESAPKTVENFKHLVSQKFYDGLTFHRAVPGFVIQGGDPRGDGTGGADAKIPGEFLSNGVFNPLKHTRGVLSMARSQDPNSASSQFFIVLDNRAGSALNDKYAAFGQVIYGMTSVDSIAALPTVRETIQEKPVIQRAYFITEAAGEQARAAEPKPLTKEVVKQSAGGTKESAGR